MVQPTELLMAMLLALLTGMPWVLQMVTRTDLRLVQTTEQLMVTL